jgi:hypothetical protein
MDSNNTKRRYCISVDGSQYSDWAFDIVFEELYQSGDYVIVTHIANPDKSDYIPFEYQADTIMSKYDTKLVTKLPADKYEIIKENRDKNTDHAQQVNKVAKQHNATILAIGFLGHKVGKAKNDFTKGVIYLSSNVKLPTLVIKENSRRADKLNKAFTWLIAIEQKSSRSFKAFQFAMNYINKSVDNVIGYHIDIYDSKEEIQEEFNNFCQSEGIQNYKFCIENKNKSLSIGNQISNFINFSDSLYVDFLVIGHNPHKYTNVEEIPLFEIFKSVQANVLFYN